MAPSPRAIVAQHARTAQLLGVDFLPVSASGSAAAPAAVPAPHPSAPATPATPPSPRDRVATRAALDAINARYTAEAPHARFTTAHNTLVFGEGDPCARLMFVGEAPGADEDRLGRPFVGRAGQLLDKMIAAMGLKREAVYISNILKTRPPNNATPTIEEAALCLPYVQDEIDTVRPEAIVTLGLTATRALLATDETMGRMRGRWTDFAHPRTGTRIPVMPTFHPAFILRQYTDENRAKVWSDLKLVMDRLGIAPARRA